ncbi:patellin-6-like [Amaranthus tricolor]|uniref:patellin-6-like n=1 Tax=Amaranthus tricolor TaxID=29722 RepID=UPI00258CF2AB|nr:patellin-6-like [Amaranthus tricolor]
MITISSHDIQCSESPPIEINGRKTSQPSKEIGLNFDDDDDSPLEISDNEGLSSPSDDQDSDYEPIISSEGEASSHNKNDYNSTPTKERTPNTRRKIFRRRWKRVKAKKSLMDFKTRLEDALNDNFLHNDLERKGIVTHNCMDISLWGVPLLPSKGHEGLDIILLKFLKAQSYKVNEAMENLKQTLIWREEFGINDLINEELGDWKEVSKMVFLDSVDKEGHPICFNLYGGFRDKELYGNAFGTEQNRRDFVRWRVQFMEKSIKRLNFKGGGVDSFLVISDMKNAPGPSSSMKDLGPISKQLVSLFQRYYPELIYKHIIINVPFWYYLYHGVVTQYCTSGTKRKFVFARPHRVTETLLKYIPPQNLQHQYGGLRQENDEEFTSKDPVLEFSLRPGAVSAFQLPISEVNVTVVWEVMVVGWEVSYKDEFIPEDEGSYKILLHKEENISKCVRNSFYINEPGKIYISIKNATYIRKKAFIRLKTKLTLPLYMYT